MIAEDLYLAMIDAAQSLLMYIGIGPPAPKVIVNEIRKHLVDAKLLEDEYAKALEDVIDFRKRVEHKEIKNITGKEVDEWIEKAEKYVNRFEKLLNDLEIEKKAYDIKRNYEVMVKASVAALKSLKKLPKEPEKLPEAFKKYLVDAGLVNPRYSDVFGKVIEMRKMLEDKKLDKIKERDVYMSKEYVRRFIMDIRRFIEKPLPIDEETKEKIEKTEKPVKRAKKKKK